MYIYYLISYYTYCIYERIRRHSSVFVFGGMAQMEGASAKEVIDYNARHARPWRLTNGVGGMVKFVCNAEDRAGQKDSFEFEFEIHPDEVKAGLADPARQRDLLCSVANACKHMSLKAESWMCMACGRQACEIRV